MNNLRARLDRNRLIERLVALVRTPSENPPGNEAGAAAIAADFCSELGFEVASHEKVPGRPNLVARLHFGPGPVVAFCSHLDVVPAGDTALWEVDPFSAHLEGERMLGRGTADAKGTIAAAIEAASLLTRSGAPLSGTLELDLVSDEETMGFQGAGFLTEQGLIAPDFAIVGEPTSLRIVHAQRGAAWFRVTTRGRAAHGSAPERGVSAIRHMAEIVSRLEETLPDISHPVLGGPSINVGTIHGGEKVNVVPASCWIEVDRRTVPGETPARVLASVEEAIDLARARFPEIDATVELAFSANPFEIDPGAALVAAVGDAVHSVTGRPSELAGFRGASDARFLAEAGAQVVVCGPGDITVAHTAREEVSLFEVEQAALVYALAWGNLLAAAH